MAHDVRCNMLLMMTNNQPMQSVSPVVEVLVQLLGDVPGSHEEIKARRQEVLAAAASFDPSSHQVAQALSSCIKRLRARAAEVRRAVPSRPTEPRPEVVFHERETVLMPPLPERPAPAVERMTWDATERMLYEDVLNLFELGDQAGAMTSLERLVMLNPHAEELATFIEKNGSLLRSLYEEHFGSLDRVPVPMQDAHPIKIPTRYPQVVMDVLRLVDGHRSIRDILKRSVLGEVQTLCSVGHLARCGFLELA